MKILGLVLLLISLSKITFGQAKMDSTGSRQRLIRTDSLANSTSIQGKADSIKNEFNAGTTALKSSYDSTMLSIDRPRQQLMEKIDSLNKLKLPCGKFTRELDSLNQLRSEQQASFERRLADLKTKTTGKIHALDLPSQYKEPLTAVTKDVDAFSLPDDSPTGHFFKVPGMKLPDEANAALPGVKNPSSDLSQYTSLPNVETPVGEPRELIGDVNQYQGDLKNLTSGNLADVDKSIEQHAGEVEGIDHLQQETSLEKGMKEKLEPLKNPASGKGKAVELSKQAVINHFAGKEQQLKSAMDQMSKYKGKYNAVSSIEGGRTVIRNVMKGKPFEERIVHGLYFQYQQKRYHLFDFNLYTGYRLSGRFTAGLGWNQRFARDKNQREWNRNARVYGPRIYVDARIIKGFTAHVEMETINTFIHANIQNQTFEHGRRHWVWGMMVGLKKDYKIYKHLHGTVLIQYNVFNAKFHAPYVDRLNSRIGVEYRLGT